MTLAEVSDCVSDHLDEITVLFKPGVKITIVVRTPDFPERDFVMTSDTLVEVKALVERRQAAGQV